MNKQGNMALSKEENKASAINHKVIEINKLPDKEFKVII
jgi:hypothetical protein